jgi:hypothetical protein
VRAGSSTPLVKPLLINNHILGSGQQFLHPEYLMESDTTPESVNIHETEHFSEKNIKLHP